MPSFKNTHTHKCLFKVFAIGLKLNSAIPTLIETILFSFYLLFHKEITTFCFIRKLYGIEFLFLSSVSPFIVSVIYCYFNLYILFS